MQLGMIGLGKVGTGLTRRLLSGGYKMVVFDRDPEAVAAAAANIAQRRLRLTSLKEGCARFCIRWCSLIGSDSGIEEDW